MPLYTTVETLPIAEEYQRVHFVAHCYFHYPDIEALEKEIKARISEIEEVAGYRCFYVRTETRGLEPIWTDIDFIWDLPATEEIESPPLTVAVKVILAVLAILGILVVALIFWTIYVEEVMIFYCDQHDPPMRFFGRADYDAHLKLEHPEKWEYIEEQREEAFWWLKLIEWLPMVMGMLLLMTIIAYIPRPPPPPPERRRE